MEKKFGKAAQRELLDNGIAEDAVRLGEQKKYNHTTCPAGEDTRQRLYVINKGGAILYHCHNCGGSGHYRPKESYSPIRGEGHVEHLLRHKTPTDHRVCPAPFTDEMLLWLLNYEIDPEEFTPGVFCPATDGSLPISVYNGDKYVGYQRRYFSGRTKYLSRASSPYHYLIGKEFPDVVVVVEDLLSSYKVWSLGYSVLCLLGTSLKGPWPEELRSVSTVVVWLDNDTAGHAGSIKFLREMKVLFPSLITYFDRQPKEVPYTELTTILEGFRNGS